MGQKIHPKGFRLGSLYSWESRWFAQGKQYSDFILEDAKIREALFKRLRPSGITRIEIERSINKMNIILHVVRPGMVIGRGGKGMEEIKKFVMSLISYRGKKRGELDKKSSFTLDIRVEPVKEPYLDAYFVGTQIADQLARRLPHKRVLKFAMDKVMTAKAKGVKVLLSGRIAGAEIARKETYMRGTIPLSTIREDIDFASTPSLTKSGYIGVKVWICK